MFLLFGVLNKFKNKIDIKQASPPPPQLFG